MEKGRKGEAKGWNGGCSPIYFGGSAPPTAKVLCDLFAFDGDDNDEVRCLLPCIALLLHCR